MGKKRKLRSSEPEPQPQEPHQSQPEQQPIPEEEEEEEEDDVQILGHQQPETMDEEEAGDGEEEQLHEDEEEEEESDDDEEEEEEEQEQGGSNVAVSSEATAVDVNGRTGYDGGGGLELEEPIEKLLEPFTKEQLATLVKEAAERFPEFVDSVRKIADADPAHRKIFVHGLGWDTTAETLISEFGKYGEIEDCKAVTDKVSGKSKGYAFILFKHRNGSRNALKQPQKKIGSRMTSCQLASAGPVPAPPPVVPPVSEYTLRKIFVSNVSAEIDPGKLLEFFSQYGEIEEGPLGLDKQTGKPKGFALFVYRSVESAKRALEEPHKTFEGHTLHCQKAIDGPKQNKPYHQHQHQYQPHFSSRKEKSKYPPSGGAGHGPGQGQGHLMAPSGPGVGFNPAVAAQALNPALGQALTALLATQGAGLGLTNLLGGLGGAPMNQAGPPVMNNAGYGNQPGMNYGNQLGMQGGYQNPQMGQSSGARPQPGNMGGTPYMGH